MYPNQTPTDALYAGQVGYLVAGMKTVQEARVGETIYHTKRPIEAFPGFKPAKPMVFAGIFPVDSEEFDSLRDSIEKLTLNDASVKVERNSSTALGLGFRCGFLGLLHMDVFKQRLEQEYGQVVIVTAPSVLYKVKLEHTDQVIDVESPSDFPDPSKIEVVLEPIIDTTILTPSEYLGAIIKFCQDKRGVQKHLEYLTPERIILKYRLPLNEIATDFYDQLKSVTSGYAHSIMKKPAIKKLIWSKWIFYLMASRLMLFLALSIVKMLITRVENYVKSSEKLFIDNFLKSLFKLLLEQKL